MDQKVVRSPLALLTGVVFRISVAIFIYIIFSLPGTVQASITLDEANKVKLFGDVRFRLERDDRTNSGGTDQDRERLRVRARVGVSAQPDPHWSGRIRLSTQSTSLNSPHTTFGTADTSKNGNFGLDQAYVAYKPTDPFTLVMGKTAINFWQQNEVFWDTDINPEALAVVYDAGVVTLNAAYVIVAEGSWADDVTITTYQAVHKGKAGDLKYAVALGGASTSKDENIGRDTNGNGISDVFGFQSDSNWIASTQVKGGQWRAGLDMLGGNADTEDSAYVLQGRYKLSDKSGLRLYYYHVEAFSLPGDGTFSQDNFPNPGNTGVSNFEGFRLQYDYKISKNTALDIRYYDMERIEPTGTLSATASDALINDQDRNRIQLNINVKF
ncbi:MAG: hypothetical protein GXP19_04085 [Gammaproteobacteria bacterium]|nr:hypothetical protein [Gammaproteobacteria bacterium]